MGYACLLNDNNRSRAYIQNFTRQGYAPSRVIVLGKETQNAVPESEKISTVHGMDVCFNQNESVFTTLRNCGIPHTVIPVENANEPIVVNEIANLSETDIIYSGAGGVILRERILSQNKRFFHSHPGIVPEYRGSTTFYYSMLLKQMIGCSVMILDAKIDTGDVVFSKEYTVPPMPIDYDRVVDPLIRAQTFISLLFSVSGDLQNVTPLSQKGESNTFYIIHPVLKHLAILGQN